jgi:hypothetical protein
MATLQEKATRVLWFLKTDYIRKQKLPLDFMMVSCSAYFSTVNMEARFSSKTSVDFQRTTWHIPEARTLHNHRYYCFLPHVSQFTFRFSNGYMEALQVVA